MTFYLGTHKAAHLGRTAVPLFLNRRQLAGRATFPRAAGPWRLDSGGFTELGLYGRWELTAPAYAAEVRRYATEVGRLEAAACRDYIAAPEALAATGLTVREHQLRTVGNYLEDRDELGDLVRPVVQGWTLDEYRRHVDDYAAAGVDLTVGLTFLGSVAMRDDTPGVELLVRELAGAGMRVHVLGAKAGLARYGDVADGDSTAWSREARSRPPMPGHAHGTTGRGTCQNCLPYALRWRTELLELIHRAGDGDTALGLLA